MKTVHLTQYLRPDGGRQLVLTEISDEAAQKYDEINELRGKLTCEVLTTNEVSLAIEFSNGDWDLELVPNGPGTVQALEKLLLRFNKEEFLKHKGKKI